MHNGGPLPTLLYAQCPVRLFGLSYIDPCAQDTFGILVVDQEENVFACVLILFRLAPPYVSFCKFHVNEIETTYINFPSVEVADYILTAACKSRFLLCTGR